MDTFFTSDLHLGHDNVIKYCNRPFKDGNHMNNSLIRNWNQRVKKDDLIYHLGDFCFKGGKEGGKNKSLYWEEQLRRMSRKKAKETLNLEEEQKKLNDLGIIHSIRGIQNLDEAPSAYKDIYTVMKEQEDLVEIKTILTPLGCIKG